MGNPILKKLIQTGLKSLSKGKATHNTAKSLRKPLSVPREIIGTHDANISTPYKLGESIYSSRKQIWAIIRKNT